MVTRDVEGPLGRAEDLDLARGVGLDPDGRLGRVDVAEDGAQDQFSDVPTLVAALRGA